MQKQTALYLLASLIAFASFGVRNAIAQSRVLAEIQDLDSREHRQEGFILTSKQTVRIDAVGAGPSEGRNWNSDRDEDRDLWQGDAWILDATSREIVWHLSDSDTDRIDDDLRSFDREVTLPSGTYELHYGSYLSYSFSTNVRKGISGLISNIFEDSDRRRRGGRYSHDYLAGELRVSVSGVGERASWKDLREAAESFDESAIVALHPYRAESERFGFELASTTDLELLAVGEMDAQGEYDYGWILDIESGDRVWEMDYYDSERAGGGDKNRVVQEKIRLPAGRYVAYFVADDSHDPEEWNSMPPFDTKFWGLTIWAPDEIARTGVRTFEYEPIPSDLTFVSMTGIGDDELVSESFSVSETIDVRVYAIGEGTGNDMADHAWIVNRDSRERVWQMNYRDTDHAGGARKNRIARERLRLDPGTYVVYYRTDGSHSYQEWNSGPPAEAAYWGVSVFAANEVDFRAVGPAIHQSGKAVIAELVRIGDNDSERVRFELDRESDLRIIALGEGQSGDMYDLAWIEDRGTGRTVWEQTYRKTDHAGGARKNRIFDGTITLPAGEYYLRYRSDGSHSYEDWNADPPNDPDAWGVTILAGVLGS